MLLDGWYMLWQSGCWEGCNCAMRNSCNEYDLPKSICSLWPRSEVKSIYMMCKLCHLFRLRFGFLMISLLLQDLSLPLLLALYQTGNLMSVLLDYQISTIILFNNHTWILNIVQESSIVNLLFTCSCECLSGCWLLLGMDYVLLLYTTCRRTVHYWLENQVINAIWNSQGDYGCFVLQSDLVYVSFDHGTCLVFTYSCWTGKYISEN